jgi:hypothetical protein
MALNLSLTFSTAMTSIERYADYDFTSSSAPTETQVEEYAYDVAGLIVTLTQRSGLRYVPPASAISDTYLARLLTTANDIGAAYLARHQMFTGNQDDPSLKVMERLAGLWQAYLGEGAMNVGAGLAALQIGSGGLIQQAIETSSGSRLLVTAVSQGEVTLEDLANKTQAITYSIEDRD